MTASFERRTLLKLAAGAGAALAAGGPGLLAPDSAAAARGDVLDPEGGFAVDIPGLPALSANVREIAIDELTVDVRELTTGVDADWRMYGPGAAHWGSVKLSFVATPETRAELASWTETAQGKNIRKNITVARFKSDKTPGRSFNLAGAFPTKWTSVRFDSGSDVAMETLTLVVEGIQLDAADDDTDDEPREDIG
jgi:phage tail-like protein